MDKKEALEKITNLIESVKLVPAFKGRAELIRRLTSCYDMVNIYKSATNYNLICAKMAKQMFNKAMDELLLSRGRRD